MTQTIQTQQAWSPEQSEELYFLNYWANGYFRINQAGNLEVVPRPGQPERSIDLHALVRDLRRRGLNAPLLLRFNGILKDRVEHLFGCFSQSIGEYGYQGHYRGVYPIKVNQQRQVVEALLKAGRNHHLGMEVGSKPELLAVLALMDDPEALLICNGYKDRAFLETALYATKLGHHPVVVIERFRELEELLDASEKLGIVPTIGLRAKLSTRGTGRWESSSGERSKFGLGPSEMVRAVELLRARGRLDCLKLLHFHIGSQITAISNIKKALREGARLYVELCRLGADLQYLDVGGGLGVDYDGSRTNFQVSIDYTDQEYANDVVWIIQETCDHAEVPHPDIISESGRAMVAHHSALIVDVTGASNRAERPLPPAPGDDAPMILQNLWESYQSVTRKNCREVFHDVNGYKDEVMTLFAHGILSLEQRALADEIARLTYHKVLKVARHLDPFPEEMEGLDQTLADIYFCNFSIFQSLPDSWAIHHLFPVVPIHRHNETPARPVVLADITCDSDGKMDQFIDLKDVRTSLPVHDLRPGESYALAFFLVGAYQEILGDQHNLFGDTNAVHVEIAADGSYEIDHIVEGDRISEVLGYVEYHKADLMARVRKVTERAVRTGTMTFEESARFVKKYEEGIEGSTYPDE